MLKKSINHNPNYLAKIVKLENSKKHFNADKLLCWDIDFQNVITNMEYNEDDIVVFFPVETSINKDLISFINGFTDSKKNLNKEIKGFFDNNARVRAILLRGERSQGFIIHLTILKEWLKSEGFEDDISQSDIKIGTEFDTYRNILICEKYIPKILEKQIIKKQKISRLIENQFRLHNDTSNLRKNIHLIYPDDIIGLHYKKHGTSWVVGNVLTNRKLNWFELILDKFKLCQISKSEYSIIYSSRRVIKNEYESINTNNKKSYYKSDIWEYIKEQIQEKIPTGYTLYGEAIGFNKDGSPIKDKYDYGCVPSEYKIYIYRITVTNASGDVLELDDMQIKQFCDTNGLLYSDTFIYYGKAKDLYPNIILDNEWHSNFIKQLEKDYNEKNCYMCKNTVPEEGIILRKQDAFKYIAFKLKSFRFLENETKDLDKGIIDIESN